MDNRVQMRLSQKQEHCYICHGTKHVARTCKAQETCENCGRRTICNQLLNGAQQATSNYPVHGVGPIGALGAHSAQLPQPVPRSAVTFPCNAGNSTVLLQTATVWLITLQKNMLARCLLDGGSQQNFICEDISC